MKTQYTFLIETFVQHPGQLSFHTTKADVVLIPDSDDKKNKELTKATVTVDGKFSFEGMLQARYELMKILLRNVPKGARIIDGIGLMPDTYEEIKDDKDQTNAKPIKGITVKGSARCLIPYDKMRNEPLRIDTDSNSPAIFCYYDSMRKTHPVDGYRELFKVIEYFSGAKEGGKKDKQRILDHLDKTWWIPDDALDMARRFLREENLSSIDLASRLVDLRGKCSHMRPDYGLTPTDLYGQARLTEMSIVLETVVRHSLERNPKTRDGQTSGGRS